MVPVVEQRGHVQHVLRVHQQLDALPDSLHHTELDHVVHQFDEVIEASPPTSRGLRVELSRPVALVFVEAELPRNSAVSGESVVAAVGVGDPIEISSFNSRGRFPSANGPFKPT